MTLILLIILLGWVFLQMLLGVALLYFWPAVFAFAAHHAFGLGNFGCAIVFVAVLIPTALSCAYHYQCMVSRHGEAVFDGCWDLWVGFNPLQIAIGLPRFVWDFCRDPKHASNVLIAHADQGWC